SRLKNKRSIQAKKNTKEKGYSDLKSHQKQKTKKILSINEVMLKHKYALFAKNHFKEAADDDQTNETRIQYFTDSNE
ncbi:Hypothetical predicted protein, partial [Paramuricea clavata]